MTILVHLSINKPYGNQVTCGATCTQSIFVTCLQTHVQIPGVSSHSTAGGSLGRPSFLNTLLSGRSNTSCDLQHFTPAFLSL